MSAANDSPIGVMPVQFTVGTAVPSSRLEWSQWGRVMIEERGLCAGEANMLRLLVDRANGPGQVRLGVPLMARQLALSESRVYYWLGKLTERDLLRTQQRGRGLVALRQLVGVPAPAQMSLFDAPVAQPARAPRVVAGRVPSPWSRTRPADACPRAGEAKPSRQREAAVEGQQLHEETRPRENVLEGHLDEVLAILTAAELFPEPLAVNSALAAFPESAGHDHLQAARVVASYGYEGDFHNPGANRLLMNILRKQTVPRAGSADRWHQGRRRRQLSAEAQEQVDRENAGANRLLSGMDWPTVQDKRARPAAPNSVLAAMGWST